jgi:hypothetical protein
MRHLVTRLTALALAGIAALHLSWAFGSSFPYPTRDQLADSVVGRDDVPPPSACVAVAVALAAAAVLVGGRPQLPPTLRRIGLVGVTTVLGGRAAMGFAGRTDVVSPGSASARFRQLDRRVFSPLCLGLAAGSAAALRDG